ncbi:dTDP-glucose 4,6-dehydratase [Streptomyces sp. NPDC001820]|uniref:dTDP-glucose 4,6-dehydratase n=1 Tax=Streptomyces sp. NPDC001820 TaxID=3364613 RepID=UPI0036B683DC
MTRVLVTGGAGFIGSHYVRTLLGPGGPGDVTVTVLDALTYAGNRANLTPVEAHPSLTFVHGNICDVELVHALMSDHDQVVHFAAESHVDRSIRDAAGFVRTNVVGTQNLLDAALRHEVGRFLYVSTDEVYGSIENGSWTESSPLQPNTPYAASKAAGDMLALSQHRTHGLDVRVTRCSNNYGPYQFPEKLIPLFITRLLDGREAPLYGDGGNIRDWLHVEDHVRAVELVRTRGRAGEAYNIGGGTLMANRDLVDLIVRACDADWDQIRYVEDRKGHDRRYCVDHTRITEELGYRPTVDLTTGLAETVTWYRTNRSWWEPLLADAVLT